MQISVTKRSAAVAVFLVIAAMLACSISESPQAARPARDSAMDHQAIGVAAGAAAPAQGATRLRTTPASFAAEKNAAAPPSLPAISQQPAQPSMIIRNGDVAIQVDSVEAAIAAIRQLVATLGGYVGNVSTFTGEHQVRSATLELKIPVARFDEAMAGVRPIGEVERSVATAQDVGEEFVDVSARVANSRRLESRLVTLLSTRTGKLEDVLAVERELARVREEIERYEGRIRFLSSRVALSTISVTVHEKAPIVAMTPGTNIIKEAFVNMWRNFVRFVAFGIEIMGVLVPIVAIALVAWFGWRRWGPKRVTASTAGA